MRVDKVLVGLSVLVLVGCQGVPAPPVTVSHPVSSSGFEEGLEAWEVEASGPTLRAEADTTVAATGTGSVRLTSEEEAGQVILRIAEPIPLDPDTTYAFAFSYACAAPDDEAFPPAPSVRIMVFNRDGEALTSEYRRFAASPVTDRWGRFSATFRSLNIPSVARPEVWLEQELGVIWVDDVVFGPVDGTPGANLVANGGFERGEAGTPSDWVFYNPSPWLAQDVVTLSHLLGAQVTVRWQERGARTGRRCLSMERSGEESREWLRCQQLISLRGGETYLVSAWVKTKDVAEAALLTGQLTPSRIEQGAQPGDQVFSGATGHLSGTADWQQIERTVTVPADAPTYVLRLNLALIDRGKVWFDDVAVIHLPTVELVE